MLGRSRISSWFFASIPFMKLVLQIAAGIFFAGLLSWLFWLGVLSAAVVAVQLPKFPTVAPLRVVPVVLPSVPGVVVDPVVIAEPRCVNFVQMSGGERRCFVPRGAVKAVK